MSKIGNWTTEEKIEAMLVRGWVVKERIEVPDEGRVRILLHNPDKKVVTYRSLPL